MATTVERRGAGADLLHQVFEEHLEPFLDELDARGGALPSHVLREVNAFRGCGDISQGFGWLKCNNCDHHRLVPLSCSGRGFCPSCGGRRMATSADHWIQRVLPDVPVRQWVITLAWNRRWLLAYRPDLCLEVRKIFHEVLKEL